MSSAVTQLWQRAELCIEVCFVYACECNCSLLELALELELEKQPGDSVWLFLYVSDLKIKLCFK